MRFWNLPLLCSMVLAVGCSRSTEPRHSTQQSPKAVSKTELGSLSSQPLVRRLSQDDDRNTLFAELPSDRTGLEFHMELYDPVTHIRALMFLTACGGICTGDFDDDGLADIYVTSPVGGNRLYRNLGGLRFDDVTEAVGMLRADFWGTGASFVDIDNDGDLDIYACGYDVPNQLWINDHGTFTEQARQYGLDYNGASMTMAFADIDNDGDLDGYLATTAKAPPPGVKFGVRFEGNKPVIPEALREYWELIYLPGDRAHRTEAGQFDHLFRNDGGRFTDITKESGIDGPYFSLSATWWDYNYDGFPDVYVSNDYMGPDKLYHNNGDNTFTDVIRDVVPRTPWFSMGSDVADLNNDGLLDFFASDMSATNHYRDKVMMGNMEDTGWFLDFAEPRQYMRNAVYLNSGSGKMLEVAFQTGLASTDWTWTPRLEDFDNDGRVDVFATNGILRDAMNSDISQMAAKRFKDGSRQWAQFWAQQPMHQEPNLAFRNAGNLKFQDVSTDWGLDRTGVSFGAATADFDNDGDLDLVVNNADANMSLFENQSDSGNRLRVRLRGTHSNRYGVGATVHVRAGGEHQTRYMTLARGWLSASEPVLHFGLGECSVIDELVVEWPSGHVQRFQKFPTDQVCTITEPPSEPPTRLAKEQTPQFAATAVFQESPAFGGTQHQERPFDDFSVQPLLPNRQSQMGPALALADVDGDGDVDGFLGGAHGSAGQLLINDGSGFSNAIVPAFADDAEYEDVDAIFFDIDGDADQDLFVVSGSNEWKPGASQYRDRIYINDGAGQFSRDPQATPDLRDNGSCVAACDFDADGDTDVFIGGRAIPGSYPLPASSRLLINENGRLVESTPASFAEIGIVTDAMWADVNGDQQIDLMLTTEWGPVRCLINDNGKLTEATVAQGLGQHLGWWNSIDGGDVDGDGDIDFLVTNFGHNTKYKATHAHPELLYYGDLDGTGRPHIVEAKYDGDRCLPRRGFSCSRNAMPFLDPKLKTFHNFASSTLTEIYNPTKLEQCQQFQINTLTTSLLINHGTDGFQLQPLPELAQVAPCMCGIFVDANQDGQLDIVLAQNFYAAQRETGRLNGGLSLLLYGDGKGEFTPIWARESGISVARDARRVVATDLNGDGSPDLIFAANDGLSVALLNSQ